MAKSIFDEHYKTYHGPVAVVRACNYCRHIEKVPVGRAGVGRGYGMREGNKARGRMIQHIKDHHQGEVK